MSSFSIGRVGASPIQDRAPREQSQSGLRHDKNSEGEEKSGKESNLHDGSVFVLSPQRIHSCEVLQTLHEIDTAIVLLQTIGIFLLQIEKELQDLQRLEGTALFTALSAVEKGLAARTHHAQHLFSGERRRIVIPLGLLIEDRDVLVLPMKPFHISFQRLGLREADGSWSSLLSRSGKDLLLLQASQWLHDKQHIIVEYEQHLEQALTEIMQADLAEGELQSSEQVGAALGRLTEQLSSKESFRSMLRQLDVEVLKDGSRRHL